MGAPLARLVLLALLLISSVATTGFGPPTLIESESADTAVSSLTLKQMGADRPPQIVAKAAVVIDAATGAVIYEKNAHQRRAPASTTKMMTALVTLEKARLDEVVTASPNVKVEPSIIGLDPGDQLTVEQLLYGLLLPSGNDAAVALADHVGGSMSRFAALMNARAEQLGLKDTHFVNSHGLDVDGHYSSAYDLAIIARTALQNPVFGKIVATREYRIAAPIRWMFKNNNQLLGSYPGADGVKTGYTDNAGRCLVASATRSSKRVISVVLDSDAMWDDSTALLDYYFTNYDSVTLGEADNPLGSYGQGDEPRRTIVKAPVRVTFPMWQRPYLRRFFSIPPSDSSRDGNAGTVTYYLFGRKVGGVELYDDGD